MTRHKRPERFTIRGFSISSETPRGQQLAGFYYTWREARGAQRRDGFLWPTTIVEIDVTVRRECKQLTAKGAW